MQNISETVLGLPPQKATKIWFSSSRTCGSRSDAGKTTLQSNVRQALSIGLAYKGWKLSTFSMCIRFFINPIASCYVVCIFICKLGLYSGLCPLIAIELLQYLCIVYPLLLLRASWSHKSARFSVCTCTKSLLCCPTNHVAHAVTVRHSAPPSFVRQQTRRGDGNRTIGRVWFSGWLDRLYKLHSSAAFGERWTGRRPRRPPGLRADDRPFSAGPCGARLVGPRSSTVACNVITSWWWQAVEPTSRRKPANRRRQRVRSRHGGLQLVPLNGRGIERTLPGDEILE